MSIAVVIPTFNRAYCLPRALESVFKQTTQPDQVIVVDDGSTDDTANLLKQYHDKVIYIKQSNQGVSQARNTGILSAKTEWVALLDSDDAWHPTKLAKQLQILTQEKTLLCHTDERWYRNGKHLNQKKVHQKFGGWIFEHCLPLCVISPSSAVIHQKIFTEVGLFNPALPACEDYDLWLRITAKFPVSFIPEPLTFKYGGHPDQLSKKHWGMDRFRIQALANLIEEDALDNSQLHAAKQMLIKKIKIYLQGAKKRNKQQEVEYYSNMLGTQ